MPEKEQPSVYQPLQLELLLFSAPPSLLRLHALNTRNKQNNKLGSSAGRSDGWISTSVQFCWTVCEWTFEQSISQRFAVDLLARCCSCGALISVLCFQKKYFCKVPLLLHTHMQTSLAVLEHLTLSFAVKDGMES